MATGDSDAIWQPVLDELARWRAAGRSARLWLRDDDASEVTPALRRLADLVGRHEVGVLMAVIPARAQDDLRQFFSQAPLLDPAVHGFAHVDHAAAGEKTQEFPVHRGAPVIRAEIGRGRKRLLEIFGTRLVPIYVPPWNRISPEVAALLPALGFTALSAFGNRRSMPPEHPFLEINAHLDIIDWKRGRAGRAHDWLAQELALELAKARAEGREHVGILTHHLVHDATAWSFLEALLERLGRHPAVHWTRASSLIEDARVSAPPSH